MLIVQILSSNTPPIYFIDWTFSCYDRSKEEGFILVYVFSLLFMVLTSLYLRPRGRQNMMVAETCGLRWKVETVWGDIRD